MYIKNGALDTFVPLHRKQPKHGISILFNTSHRNATVINLELLPRRRLTTAQPGQPTTRVVESINTSGSPTSKFQTFQRFLINFRNPGLERMEKQVQYETVFNHFDTNKDGKLSPLELQQCVVSMGGELTAGEAESVVATLDSDGDGLLEFDDFLKFVNGGEEDEKMKVMVEAFDMYKMDGCEWITAASLRRMLGRVGRKMTVEECGKVIRVFDLNGDGVLSFDEFKTMMG